jgi:NDP-sugar pyrophosphorylase family protein
MNSSIKNLVNKNAYTANESISKTVLNNMMSTNLIHQVPIIAKNGKVLNLYMGDKAIHSNKIKNLVIIMAGGKGKRMLPYTKKCPKPLLLLDNKPILEHILNKAKSDGFQNFYLSINYLGHMIKNFFGKGKNLGINIKYIQESFPLGTAGSLSLLRPKPKIPFIVSNGDVISEIGFKNLLDFHIKNKAFATVAVKPYQLRNPYGVVKTNGNEITDLEEKPISKSYVNAGVYAFDPIVLKYIEKNKILDMNKLIKDLINKSKKVIAYTAYESWFDVGRPSDLKKLSKN